MRLAQQNGKRRKRRTKQEIQRLCEAMYTALEDNYPATVRWVFYCLFVQGLIAKTEYGGTVDRLLVKMRRSGEIPYEWIVDNTRWMRKPVSFSSLDSALELTKETYRRALWRDQRVHVEIWCEKEALAGVFYEVTSQWDVGLMVAKGYSSITFLHESAEYLRRQERPCFLYHFGDFDPDGLNIGKKVESTLREMAPDAEIHFKRLAVTKTQINRWKLPSAPLTKRDRENKNFKGAEKVQLDAISPNRLRKLCEDAITQHVDQTILDRTMAIEEEERSTLADMVLSFGSSGGTKRRTRRKKRGGKQ